MDPLICLQTNEDRKLGPETRTDETVQGHILSGLVIFTEVKNTASLMDAALSHQG